LLAAAVPSASGAHQLPQLPPPYPVSDAELSDDESDAGGEASTALGSDDPRMKEGMVREDMKMEAFTAVFPPFQMMWASRDWLDFCGFHRCDIAGKSLKAIQGPDTDAETIGALMDAVARLATMRVRLVNYTRNGIPFEHDVEVEPMRNSQGDAVLYKVSSHNVCTLVSGGVHVTSAPLSPDDGSNDELE